MLIIGTHFFCWRVGVTAEAWHCGQCGANAPFALKKGMRFITLFFIPVIPISGVKQFVECPHCSARYQASAELTAA